MSDEEGQELVTKPFKFVTGTARLQNIPSPKKWSDLELTRG
ncbi:hypothetical protein TGAMA5MH_10882 [Trichoderma gamsii]|uniref:Uncharacterized protein n=1 Tax=Trichoderma gamsii TaxID=398673 RepID=A0A2K0SVB4_9HYPO|nr:hypothetical protein TGAMA5MH_10882 [Trichoderma gamsii]